MISWVLNKKSCVQNECIEEVFFRTILIIGVLGCSAALVLDLIMTTGFGYHIWLNALLIQVLILGLYSIKKVLFQHITVTVLLAMVLLFTYRGILFGQYEHVNCPLLITIGFVGSLITKGRSRTCLRIAVFGSMMMLLFRNYEQIGVLILLRQSIPYVIMYFIITISSGVLKDRFERNQVRLTELVELLNQKNSRINHQHNELLNSYKQLADLNGSLEENVRIKTSWVEEKNQQLAQIAYANAHQVRGPLARMLGLLHLINVDPLQKDFYVSKVHNEAIEMDEITTAMGRAIEKNISGR